MVVWLFLAVPWVCLQFVIVVFPDHIHLLFLNVNDASLQMLLFENQKVRQKVSKKKSN